MKVLRNWLLIKDDLAQSISASFWYLALKLKLHISTWDDCFQFWQLCSFLIIFVCAESYCILYLWMIHFKETEEKSGGGAESSEHSRKSHEKKKKKKKHKKDKKHHHETVEAGVASEAQQQQHSARYEVKGHMRLYDFHHSILGHAQIDFFSNLLSNAMLAWGPWGWLLFRLAKFFLQLHIALGFLCMLLLICGFVRLRDASQPWGILSPRSSASLVSSLWSTYITFRSTVLSWCFWCEFPNNHIASDLFLRQCTAVMCTVEILFQDKFYIKNWNMALCFLLNSALFLQILFSTISRLELFFKWNWFGWLHVSHIESSSLLICSDWLVFRVIIIYWFYLRRVRWVVICELPLNQELPRRPGVWCHKDQAQRNRYID